MVKVVHPTRTDLERVLRTIESPPRDHELK
jgi:hypothetical protein